MKPSIDKTSFGSITIAGEAIEHDVVIRLDGKVEKRKKKLSKEIYGTSHIISLEEAKFIYEKGAEKLIIGSGQSGLVRLSDEAAAYLKDEKCKVELASTPKAIGLWNDARGRVIGLFHITC